MQSTLSSYKVRGILKKSIGGRGCKSASVVLLLIIQGSVSGVNGGQRSLQFSKLIEHERELRVSVGEVDVGLLPEAVAPPENLPDGHRVVVPERVWQIDVDIMSKATGRSVRVYTELVPEYTRAAPYSEGDRGGIEVIDVRLEAPGGPLIMLTRRPWTRNTFTLDIITVRGFGPPEVLRASASSEAWAGRSALWHQRQHLTARLSGSLQQKSLAVVVTFTGDPGAPKEFRFPWNPETRRLGLDEAEAPATLPGDR